MSPEECPEMAKLPIWPGKALAPGIANCATPWFIAASTSSVLMPKTIGLSTLSFGMISRGSGEISPVTVGSIASILVLGLPPGEI